MGKEFGGKNLGNLYTTGKVRKRREWKGLKDTLYDYSCWLKVLVMMGKFIIKPRNIKAMFRYRWMANFLAAPMMLDRHTVGLRGPYLRICHTELDLIMDDVCKLLDNIFKADRRIGNNKKLNDKIVLVDENEMTTFMMGFPNLKCLSRETPSIYVSVLLNQMAACHYIDVAQEFGLAADVCPMPEAEAGASIDDDLPIMGKCAVQCNTTCDGSLMGNGVISKRLELEDGIPCFQLAAPLRHREDDVQEYAAQEIRNCIAFIEKNTGHKWDWKFYFECAARVNESTRHRQEWLDMNKTDYPQVFGSNLALYTETNYMAICGKIPAFVEADRKITQLAQEAYKKQLRPTKECRHRAIIWGVQSHFYFDFLLWLQNCWGIYPLTDMLSMVSTRVLAETDTPENREKAIYDMAWLTENMIMRNRTHGGYKVLLDELWEFTEEFNADMVILWEHISCKALDGMHGLFEQKAREKGIKLIWVQHDLFDPRVISRQGVRDQINKYMRTIMQEEPVDPTLEILPDEKSW
ncbi:MAG: 2-hydroxyacyl-CoA dehydratase family protein [Treponemataceae bacterium]|nr:2-hydroxyacyl-CoA dehydratase family protein [Treponemataceae bacterium]